MNDNSVLNSLRMTSALAIIAGTWALLFEVYYFREFYFEIYFARVALTFIASIIFYLSYRSYAIKISTWLVHFLILSIISSFLITLYKIPDTVFINSHILSLLIFTIAIIFGWDAKNQVIVAIYYNILFAIAIFSVEENIFHFPNIFSIVMFVSFISLLSVGASSVIYSMRIKYRERNEEIKFLFSNAPIGICKMNFEGEVITANGYFYDLLSTSETSDPNVSEFIKALEKRNVIKNTISEKIYRLTDFKLKIVGKDKYLNISTKLLPTDSNRHFIELIVWDETEVKLAERARNHALKRLAEESEKREKITSKAVEQKNQKIGLLAKINHEVRTPLNSILSFFDLIENDMLKSEKELKDFGASVKVSAESLLHTINNFIDFSKIETGHMTVDKEYFNLSDVVASVENLLKPLTSSKTNKLVLNISGIKNNVVNTDEAKFRQILINLIGNANKFTSGGEIRLTIETEHSDKNNLLIATVEDTGLGIAKDKISNIFKPFESGGNIKEQEFSSGLGLSICNEFVEMLDGKIEITSEESKGTKVVVKLPVQLSNSINQDTVQS